MIARWKRRYLTVEGQGSDRSRQHGRNKSQRGQADDAKTEQEAERGGGGVKTCQMSIIVNQNEVSV